MYWDMDLLLGLPAGLQSITLINGRQVELTTTYGVISSLRPVLRIGSEIKDVMRLLHKSVFDFLTSRAGDSIRVNLHVQDGILALRCLGYMNHNLQHDICGIGDPSLLNSEVTGLSDLVHEHIPEALRYTCRLFSNHLDDMSTFPQELLGELQTFITQHLLHWIEVMSLLGELPVAEQCLQILSDYLKVNFTSM